MKKSIVLITIVVAIFCLVGCQKKAISDYEYIKNKGTLIVGITEFAPMNYHNEEGKLVGFDTELTNAVCAKLGLKPVFVDISWDLKETELASKNIDCIWNGMTITPREEQILSLTAPYISSKEIMIAKKERIAELTENHNGITITVERGSTGEQVALFIQGEIKIVPVDSQITALHDVSTGASDAAIVDYLMRFGGFGEDTKFHDLGIVEKVVSDDELMAIAFRKNSDMTKKVENILNKMKKDGTIREIASRYNLNELLVD
ncbi:MAG: transporter substrate-binding domain-containing protein [Spirochaetales bacterium]|nr:transporter substrate-binding domain-containing protein [Spirochaetales bacterium]